MKKILVPILLLIMFIPFYVNAKSKYLYDVLKDEAESGGLAREYIGEHKDSFTEEPSEKIYHWYAENDEQANQILEKNNVIFADHCWQMFRTTDTGGVKIIYNGTPLNNKCNDTSSSKKIANGFYNDTYHSPSEVGYMNNIKYNYSTKFSETNEVLTKLSMNASTNYYFGDSVSYDLSTGKYTLNNTYQAKWQNIYSTTAGLYTCQSTSNSSCSVVYYIVYPSYSYIFGYAMQDGNDLSYYDNNIILGTGYTEDNGIYTLTGTETITKLNWFNNYSKYKHYYVCDDDSSSCENLRYIIRTKNNTYNYLKLDDNYIYSSGFTYDSNTNKYILNSSRVQFWNRDEDSNIDLLSNYHYTCFNTSGECSNVYYIFGRAEYSLRYIVLENGKSVEDAINEMFYADNVNQTNSIIKRNIDRWYSNNMTEYSVFLEDTIFCNNRSIYSYGGWDPNGGNLNELLKFEESELNGSLKCSNRTDQFSLANSQARLTYPIGLMTAPEMSMLNNNNVRKGESTWLMSPNSFTDSANVRYVDSSGVISAFYLACVPGIRPVISLISDIKYLQGTGSTEDPYIIDTTKFYSVNVEIKNETEDLTVEIDDLSQVEEGETVNFKVTPIKGHKLTSIRIVDENNNEIEYTTTDNKNYTFTMPGTDVTIIPSYERVKNAVNVEDNKNTKVITIQVNDSKAVVYEDTVRFRVSPEEGYEVEKIEIVDENNNNISYKKTNNKNEYEFIMPDSNVLIIPTYRKIEYIIVPDTLKNPITGTGISIIIILMLIISSITYIILKRKKNNI